MNVSQSLHDLAAQLGLKRAGREWRGTCPACGYGSGAFVLSVGRSGRPLAWCASCQDRNAIARAIGGDALPRLARDDGVREATAKAKKQEAAVRLWRGSEPATGTPADRYLCRRGLPALAASVALRFRADCPYPQGGVFPALMALVSDVTDAPVAVHRTYLTRDGCKATVEHAKASLGPIWGCAVRLHPLAAEMPLAIGEGIESAASAGRLMGIPAWAAISAGNLGKGLVLPSEARRIVIAADPDEAGRNAAGHAWLRWKEEGRTVHIATPDGPGDFNDVLLIREAAHG